MSDFLLVLFTVIEYQAMRVLVERPLNLLDRLWKQDLVVVYRKDETPLGSCVLWGMRNIPAYREIGSVVAFAPGNGVREPLLREACTRGRELGVGLVLVTRDEKTARAAWSNAFVEVFDEDRLRWWSRLVRPRHIKLEDRRIFVRPP